jgi:hypothetical protein
MVWPSLQGFATSTDATEQAALATCVAKLSALAVLPPVQVADAVLPLILSRLSAPSVSEEVRLQRIPSIGMAWVASNDPILDFS